MSDRLPVGPYRTLTNGNESIPWYMIPFDKQGVCEGPLTRQDLLDKVKAGTFTDILLFSHGWNNNWHDATELYENFFTGYTAMRRAKGLEYGRPFRPVLVGIFWPSIALEFPWEAAPRIAGDADTPEANEVTDSKVAVERREVGELAERIAPKNRARFYTLTQQQEKLNAEQALELAAIMAPLYTSSSDELQGAKKAPAPEELVATWAAAQPDEAKRARGDNFGFVGGGGAAAHAAGGDISFDPRDIVRLATVLQMKDRAGTVGAYGVGPLLGDLLAASNARVHLIGHSYGCKVVLSATCIKPLQRPVNSILLLEPAISYLCFADNVDGTGQPGGYKTALARVEQPILSTFSAEDAPLNKFFHLAVWRKEDLGEQRTAAVPPSKYAALGGYGPDGTPAGKDIPIQPMGKPYTFDSPTIKVYGLDSTGVIHGHGDISNEATWWALYNQLKG